MENSNSSQQSAIGGQQLTAEEVALRIVEHVYGLVDGYLVEPPLNLREKMQADVVALALPLSQEITRLQNELHDLTALNYRATREWSAQIAAVYAQLNELRKSIDGDSHPRIAMLIGNEKALRAQLDAARNTMRDEFARAALVGMLAYGATKGRDSNYLGSESYRIADAMMRERGGGK